MRTILLISLMLFSLSTIAKSVAYYRCTEANGEMVLSDRPCGDDAENLEVNIRNPVLPVPEEGMPGSEDGGLVTTIPLPPIPAETPPSPAKTAGNTAPGNAKDAEKSEEPPPRYSAVEVTSPQNGAVVRSDDGSVPVAFKSTPALQQGDIYQILIDGREVARSPRNQVMISGVPKGRSALSVIILDKGGKKYIQSPVIRFIRF